MLPGTTQPPIQLLSQPADQIPTPPISKGKAPAPLQTRTPTSYPSAPKASTSQGPVQAPLPQLAAPQPPPGNLPPNPPAPAAMAQQNQPQILGTPPDPYNGSPDKAITFWNTLTNYYAINDGTYVMNAQKVLSTLTYFKISTSGGDWASDQMATALATNLVNYGMWDQFKAAFEKQFILPASQMEAIQKMHATTIGTCDFPTWFQDWSTQARCTRVDETTKMWAFRRNLPVALQQKLLMLSPQPTTLDTLVEKAWEFNCNWQIFGGSSGTPTRGQGSSHGNWQSNQHLCI